MQEPWFDPATYRSDSNQHWRSGCPHDELRAGAFPWLQLLTHPEIWAYPGETMGQTMRAMLEAEKERRLQQLADDRIDLVSGERLEASLDRRRQRHTGAAWPEADHRRRHRLGRARHRGAAARPARERRARGAPRRHGHVRALGRAPPLRRVPPRPGGLRPGLRRRDPRDRRARGRRLRAAPVVVRPRGARRAPRHLPGARARLEARHDLPLERQGRDVRVPAPARAAGAGVPARQRRRARSRPPRASSATPTCPSASSRCSRRARAASGSSIRPSTAPTSC